MNIIKVSIVDDHPMVLQGLQTILAHHPHINVVATYKNGDELMDGLTVSVPDVLLLDIQLPGRAGDELVPQLLDNYPDLKILVLTNFESPMYASKMLWQGVHGYLLKTAEEKILISAIEKVYKGEQFIERQLKDKIENHPLKSKKILSARSSLTMREKEILQFIVNGYTDQKIADTLHLSLDTIKHYRLTLLLKLDVNNTAKLVNVALKMGLAD